MSGAQCMQHGLLHSHQDLEQLTCSICLQVMSHPVRLNCSNSSHHVFGAVCIKKWIKKRGKKQCPLCRNEFTQISVHHGLKQKFDHIKTKCPQCDQPLLAGQLHFHLKQCPKYRQKKSKELTQIVCKQKQLIFKQINPHLIESHKQIYEQHVKGWQWLQWDERDWKWWWWCNNPWWKNQACQLCNVLWHKYEKDIDQLQVRRVQIIKQIVRAPGASSE